MIQPMLASLSDCLMRMSYRLLLMGVAILATQSVHPAISWSAEPSASPVRSFLSSHCYDCHTGPDAEAGLNLESLKFDLSDHANQDIWVTVFDRVEAAEMPPADDWGEADPDQRKEFLSITRRELRNVQRAEHQEIGRVKARRLTRLQIERSLQDLLGIDIPLVHLLTEERKTDGFTTVAEGQDMSLFHVQAQLAAVDAALDEAFRRALHGEKPLFRNLPAEKFVRKRPRSRTREPELLRGQAVIWNGAVTYYGRIPATTAPEDGWYEFELTVNALNLPESGGVWSTVRSGFCKSSAPLLTDVTIFEATKNSKTVKFTTWLPDGHMLEIRPADSTLKLARFSGGQIGTGEGEPQNVPGLAMDHISMRKIHLNGDDDQVRRLLFGDLPVEAEKRSKQRGDSIQVVSASPKKDASRLMQAFASRAFRRPVTNEEIEPYIRYVHQMLADGESFVDAIRGGYRAVLCSPRFIYFQENLGKLDHYAVASRLSYLLTGSMPDEKLLQAAAEEKLHDKQVIRSQVQRLLKGESGEQFLTDFAQQWLDLGEISDTQPDRRLYPEYDATVQQSMFRETVDYLIAMLREDSSVTQLVDSKHTYLNSRLARYYGIEGVTGDQMQRVALPENSRRGGLLTHGAILKVTADGTNTSPVVRGVWVNERLLGVEVPPPPANVPAVEPDVRGATTIREQLEKHRSSTQCASCHAKMDPAGFALENFDPAGRWREYYLTGRRKKGPEIDPSYQLASGEAFDDIKSFQKLIVNHPERLAENVAKKLVVFGTGSPVEFVDRPAIDSIVAKSAKSEYGLRTIIDEVVTSDLFLTK